MSVKKNVNIIGKSLLASRIVDGLKKHKVSLNKGHAELVISEMWEEITKALIKGEEIRLLGYCSFKKIKTKPRAAMNLKTRKKMIVPAKWAPKVKFSDSLKQRIVKGK